MNGSSLRQSTTARPLPDEARASTIASVLSSYAGGWLIQLARSARTDADAAELLAAACHGGYGDPEGRAWQASRDGILARWSDGSQGWIRWADVARYARQGIMQLGLPL